MMWENEKLLETSNISFSQNIFYLVGVLFAHFPSIQNCRLQTLSVQERVKSILQIDNSPFTTHFQILRTIRKDFLITLWEQRKMVIKPIPQSQPSMTLRKMPFENIYDSQHFLLFPHCFLLCHGQILPLELP